jgi:transposase
MGKAFLLDGAADATAFEIYIEQLLAPSPRTGQIVILDNLSIHQGLRVRQAIEARGCQLVFLPAYSPDFSPIEGAFSKLKAICDGWAHARAKPSRKRLSRLCPLLRLKTLSAGFCIVAILLLGPEK